MLDKCATSKVSYAHAIAHYRAANRLSIVGSAASQNIETPQKANKSLAPDGYIFDALPTEALVEVVWVPAAPRVWPREIPLPATIPQISFMAANIESQERRRPQLRRGYQVGLR
jgi:hypothetical protein